MSLNPWTQDPTCRSLLRKGETLGDKEVEILPQIPHTSFPPDQLRLAILIDLSTLFRATGPGWDLGTLILKTSTRGPNPPKQVRGSPKVTRRPQFL